MTCWSVLGLNRGLGKFLNFLGAPMLLYRKSVFLMVNVSLCWLINFSGMYLKFMVVSLMQGCPADTVNYFNIYVMELPCI
jgi:hypothetical protein